MEIAQSSCTEDVSGPTQISPLSLALYPISQPLSLILRAAILRTKDVEFRNVSSAELTPPAFKIVTEKMEIALEQIVRNCFAGALNSFDKLTFMQLVLLKNVFPPLKKYRPFTSPM